MTTSRKQPTDHDRTVPLREVTVTAGPHADVPADVDGDSRGRQCSRPAPRPAHDRARPRGLGGTRWLGRSDGQAPQGRLPTTTPALGLLSSYQDVAIVRAQLDAIPGDKILVGHSYGGSVIAQAAAGRSDVSALVYTAAFVPSEGQSLIDLGAGYLPPRPSSPDTSFSSASPSHHPRSSRRSSSAPTSQPI